MASVRVALLGCGGFMRRHAEQYKSHPDVKVVGLCDVDPAHVAKFLDENFRDVKEKPATFTDPAEMYRAVRPDAVSIATPHTLHFAQCAQALKAGLHVLVEKPMVTSLDQALALEKKVKAAKRLLCIGYNTPCTVEVKKVRDLVRSGEMGRLKLVSMYISQPWYHFVKGTWRMDPELSGGGMLYDSGAHVFNTLCWTVESDVAEVFAYVDNLDAKVDINGAVCVKFKSGVIAQVTVSGESPGGSFAAYMFENGLVELNPWYYSGYFRVWDRKGAVKYPAMAGTDFSPMHNFVEAILGRDEPRTSVRNGIYQSQLMDAIYESARTGKPARPGQKR
ncbi:MAG: Glucose--fructose oxidoreductase precursor [Lentisphaerae bacterium ADurb.BinA184]|nr:MAG: Glucose--fructose oxidoreductase precursor [Lentisphaerae bacterium ADurb.BinA184]